MSYKYIITKLNNHRMGFLLSDNHVEEIRVYTEQSLVGNVYRGVVSNVVENINAAFVDIKKGESCYLALEDYPGADKLKPGNLVTVQVTKDAIKSKQPSVSGCVSLTGGSVVVSVSEVIGVSNKIEDKAKRESLKEAFEEALSLFEVGRKTKDIRFGGIVRTQAAEVDREAFIEETVKMLCKLDDILYRAEYATAYSCIEKTKPQYVRDVEEYAVKNAPLSVITDISGIADECRTYDTLIPVEYDDDSITLASLYNLNKTLERTLSKRVYLKSGAYLVIEPTEALTTVDVNSGKAIKGKVTEEVIFSINCEAARELMRQLRLRNLSGVVIVDFINMKEHAHEVELMHLLAELAKQDSVPVHVVDMTKLGLVEMTRKKIHPPLHEILNS